MIYTWKCPICGKEIESLYEKQLESHTDIHMLTHKDEKHTSNKGGDDCEKKELEISKEKD